MSKQVNSLNIYKCKIQGQGTYTVKASLVDFQDDLAKSKKDKDAINNILSSKYQTEDELFDLVVALNRKLYGYRCYFNTYALYFQKIGRLASFIQRKFGLYVR